MLAPNSGKLYGARRHIVEVDPGTNRTGLFVYLIVDVTIWDHLDQAALRLVLYMATLNALICTNYIHMLGVTKLGTQTYPVAWTGTLFDSSVAGRRISEPPQVTLEDVNADAKPLSEQLQTWPNVENQRMYIWQRS